MSITKQITSRLYKMFSTHKYMVTNSFVYFWESDFFSQLASGYHQEVEVKISRSDFRADFKKIEKHRTLVQKSNGAKLVCVKGLTEYRVTYYKTVVATGPHGRRQRDKTGKLVYRSTGELKTKKYWSESKSRGEVSREALSCRVSFRDINCPNRFYYCCPEGMIEKHEVPEYAGLMYYTEHSGFIKIKTAPLIHKEKRDLKQILLDKFYYRFLNRL